MFMRNLLSHNLPTLHSLSLAINTCNSGAKNLRKHLEHNRDLAAQWRKGYNVEDRIAQTFLKKNAAGRNKNENLVEA